MAGQSKEPANERAIIDVLPESALVTAGGWKGGGADILHVNARFCELTGYTAAELEGRNTRLLHGPRTDATVLRHGRAPRAAASEGSGEGWLYHKEGGEFFHGRISAPPV